MKVEVAMQQILTHYNRIREKAGLMEGEYEGYALILHSLDDLWDAIRREEGAVALRVKAKEVAAEAMRFMVDVT